jgi:hypothetical protein
MFHAYQIVKSTLNMKQHDSKSLYSVSSACKCNIEVQIGEKFLSFTDPPTYTVHIISMVYF